VPALAPELLPLPLLVLAVVPFSHPPQPRAAIRATVDTKSAVRGIGVNFSQQEQDPAGLVMGRTRNSSRLQPDPRRPYTSATGRVKELR
jgi:hypothetical protein